MPLYEFRRVGAGATRGLPFSHLTFRAVYHPYFVAERPGTCDEYSPSIEKVGSAAGGEDDAIYFT